MTRLRLLILVSIIVLIPCAAIAQKPTAPPIVVTITTYGAADFAADKAQYQAAIGTGDITTAQIVRDRVVWQAMASIDYNFANWKETTLNGNSKKNFILDVLDSGLVSWAGLTSVIGTKNDVVAALQFLRGGRAAYNKNFLGAQTLGAIFNSTEAARTTKRTAIEDGLALSPQDYSLAQGLADVLVYYYEGSIASGLGHLTETAGANLQAARTDAAAARAARVNSTTVSPGRVRKPQ